MTLDGVVTRTVKADPAHAFLRHQVGRIETRPCQIPVYNSTGDLLAHQNSGPMVRVFRLMGWGETEEAALDMAGLSYD